METTTEIDDALYSRQRYVLGDSAMKRMAASKVFLSGLNGVGVETAKNIALAGVKALTVHDSKAATFTDLGTQFFLTEEDVLMKRNRAEASAPRLRELNPYTTVRADTTTVLSADMDFSLLDEYNTVILTDTPLSVQIAVNEYCRSHKPPINFLSADVRGVFAHLFVDFGAGFEVVDSTGEQLKEMYISNVTRAPEGIVSVIEHHMHGLEDGDVVTFREVKGMTELNTGMYRVKVHTPATFSIGDTSAFGEYQGGGIASQLHRKNTINHASLRDQISAPACLIADYAHFERPRQALLALQALAAFEAAHGRAPHPWDAEDFRAVLALAAEANAANADKVEAVDEAVVRALAFTAAGALAPLTAALGGWVAQEVIKGLSGKFTPLSQWLVFDAMEVVPKPDSDPAAFQPRGDRYDALRACVGAETCARLAGLRLFMVGCGAIGCELLKNYALLGVATAGEGLLTITDNDLIEKSNLNRQFLFRPHHIQQAKSTTAAESARAINPALRVDAHQHKVGPETTKTVYTDAFFRAQHMVVNALDNVVARKFVDSRCVTNQRALLESGTMGPKGHVQVIAPHLTESYGSQTDPPEPEVPYCTLKSFPSNVEHTIQWAREKFSNLFELKPAGFNKFWDDTGSLETVLETLASGACGKEYAGTPQVVKVLRNRPATWPQCVALARVKFEKYFNHKARQLISAFPLDLVLKDGSLFWTSPKRPPTPLVFNPDEESHYGFVMSAAQLYARVYGVAVDPAQLERGAVLDILATVAVPEFRPKNKTIVTDESVKKEQAEKEEAKGKGEASGDEYPQLGVEMRALVDAARQAGLDPLAKVAPESFEKDDDSNHHIDFITATSNLRASMYAIAPADRLKTKLIAGKIVPAIATTTAAVSGLVTLELIKVMNGAPLAELKNCFLNMAIPLMVFSEPAPAEKKNVAGVDITLWDRWDIQGTPDMTLGDFLKTFKDTYTLEPSGVFHNSAMIYVPFLPAMAKKMDKKMCKLLKFEKGEEYVDLTVTFEGKDGQEDAGPPVRYYLNL